MRSGRAKVEGATAWDSGLTPSRKSSKSTAREKDVISASQDSDSDRRRTTAACHGREIAPHIRTVVYVHDASRRVRVRRPAADRRRSTSRSNADTTSSLPARQQKQVRVAAGKARANKDPVECVTNPPGRHASAASVQELDLSELAKYIDWGRSSRPGPGGPFPDLKDEGWARGRARLCGGQAC